MILALTALAGGLGALARLEVGAALSRRGARRWATRVVNVTGTAALAALVVGPTGAATAQVVGVGLLGGFTTFSAWMVEASARRGRAVVVEVAVPLVAGLVVAGLVTARW